MQVGGQLAGAHLRRTRAGTDIAEIEESFRVAFLFLDDDSEHARQNILELVRALIRVGGQAANIVSNWRTHECQPRDASAMAPAPFASRSEDEGL